MKAVSTLLCGSIVIAAGCHGTDRMSAGTPQVHHVHAHHSQFSLEPRRPNRNEVSFQDRRESDQGFSSFDKQVGVATPTETGTCEVAVERRHDMPDLEGAAQAVSFPLAVVDDSVYLRNVYDSDSGGGRFDVPSGRYDVVVRFFARRAPPSEAEVGLRSWRIVVSFLPVGTVGAHCLRLEYGACPSKLFLHENDK